MHYVLTAATKAILTKFATTLNKNALNVNSQTTLISIVLSDLNCIVINATKKAISKKIVINALNVKDGVIRNLPAIIALNVEPMVISDPPVPMNFVNYVVITKNMIQTIVPKRNVEDA